MRFSASCEQNFETSLILDLLHELLLINRHRPPHLDLTWAAILSCHCTENPASCMLSVSSFSHDSVKHKILQFIMSHWQDNLDRSSSSLLSNDCTLANRTNGRSGLLTQRRILTRHPDLYLLLFLMRMTGIWALSYVWSKSFAPDSLKKISLSSTRWVIAVPEALFGS
jgi:hypothetical protein